MILLWLACKTEPEESATELKIDLPDGGGCGMAEYPILPLEGAGTPLGTIISAEFADDLSLEAPAIDNILASQGLAALTPVAYGVRAWRVRYQTQNHGQPIEATALIAVPDLDEPSQLPTLLWLHPTVGFNDPCSPSGGSLVENAFSLLWAAQGFVVAAPDYLGLNGIGEDADFLHPYVVAEPTALASLDAVRATQALLAEKNEPAQPNPAQLLHWGISEGGFAALWTDRYTPGYLPGWTSIGVIASVPATDIQALATQGSLVAGSTALTMAGALVTMQEWYGGTSDLTQVLTDAAPGFIATQLPQEMEASCDDFPSADTVTVPEDLFTSAFLSAAAQQDWESISPWGCYLGQGVLRDSAIPYASKAPVLMVTGENDDLALPGPVHDDIPRLCEQGYVIEHRQCAGLGHVDTAVQNALEQLEWARARVQGEALGTTCVVADPAPCSME